MPKSKYGGYNGPNPAQAGGRNSTFGGGKGGTKYTKGTTQGRKIGNAMRNGLKVAIRTETGDATRVASTGGVGHPPPIMGHTGGKLRKRKIQKPVWGGH